MSNENREKHVAVMDGEVAERQHQGAAGGGRQVRVEFDMWGQTCSTLFVQSVGGIWEELTPSRWIETMNDKGWMYPREVIEEETGEVLVTMEQMEMIVKNEAWDILRRAVD